MYPMPRAVITALCCTFLPTQTALAKGVKSAPVDVSIRSSLRTGKSAPGDILIRSSRRQFPEGTNLRLFQRYVAAPLVQAIKGVQKGTLVYQTENPDRTPQVQERWERIDVRALYNQ